MINSNWVFLFPLTENLCGTFTLCVTGQKQVRLAKGDASWSQHVKSTKAHGCLASLCLQALHPSGPENNFTTPPPTSLALCVRGPRPLSLLHRSVSLSSTGRSPVNFVCFKAHMREALRGMCGHM